MKKRVWLAVCLWWCMGFRFLGASPAPQQPLTFMGEEFRYVLVPFPQRDEKFGLSQKAFYRNSGTWITFNWHDTVKTPLDSLRWKESFADTPQPVIFRYAHGETEMKRLEDPAVRACVEKLGKRFVGLESLEGRWDPHKSFKTCKWPQLMGRGVPTTKDASYELVRDYFQRYLLHPLYPVIPGTCAYTAHHTAAWGANAIVTYHGSNLLCGQIQNAFARGASRQYDKLWSTYYAVFGLCIRRAFPADGLDKPMWVDDLLTYENCPSPDTVLVNQRLLKRGNLTFMGPRCGADPFTSVRQHLYTLYMCGVQLVTFESDSHRLRYASFQTPAEDALLTALHSGKTYLSPFVQVLEEVYDYSRRQSRGVPYAPVALMLDRHHGYYRYHLNRYATFAPMAEEDREVPAVIEHLFPPDRYLRNLRLGNSCRHLREMPAEQNCMVNLPYGNLFDVVTSSITLEKLRPYPVVIMAGLFGDLPRAVLQDYVAGGGTLVLSKCQAPLWKFLSESGEGSAAVRGYGGDATVWKRSLGRGHVLFAEDSYCSAVSEEKAVRHVVTPSFVRLLKTLLHAHTPVEVSFSAGSADYYLNVLPDSYLVTLTNYDGITHLTGQPVLKDARQAARFTLLRDGQPVPGVETITGRPVPAGPVELLPGEVKIIRVAR